MKLSTFMAQHDTCVFWHRVIGPKTADVLAYDSMDDMQRDTDNSLAIARATVHMDITSHPDLFDEDDLSWTIE